MSTIKANTIQPISGSDSLKIRTNDQDSLTVASNGDITVRGTAQATSFVGVGTIPIGGIIMWSGSIASIPAGWALCNGETVNGKITPDLTSKFVIGANSSGAYTVGAIGGAATHTLTAAEMPSHSHLWAGFVSNTPFQDTYFSGFLTQMAARGFPSTVLNPTTRIGELQESGAGGGELHDSGVGSYNVGSAGGNAAHNNLPPYYALAFIMRIL